MLDRLLVSNVRLPEHPVVRLEYLRRVYGLYTIWMIVLPFEDALMPDDVLVPDDM
jgi:hypothetical protein